ncbi:MAG: ribonuclease HI [Patescibacteria group bacterium]
MSKIIEIYTDGSSLGNPGRGGWGMVVTSGTKTIKELGGYEKNTTNNRMELMSVISAIKYIIENHKNGDVIIHADSTYVLGGVTTWIHNWEKNGWRTANKKQVLNKDLWQELIALVRTFDGKLSWQKVKGHDGHVHNERADTIATECSSLQKNYIL